MINKLLTKRNSWPNIYMKDVVKDIKITSLTNKNNKSWAKNVLNIYSLEDHREIYLLIQNLDMLPKLSNKFYDLKKIIFKW